MDFRIIEIDYAGQEMEILGQLTTDPELLKIFQEHQADLAKRRAASRTAHLTKPLTPAEAEARFERKRAVFITLYGGSSLATDSTTQQGEME